MVYKREGRSSVQGHAYAFRLLRPSGSSSSHHLRDLGFLPSLDLFVTPTTNFVLATLTTTTGHRGILPELVYVTMSIYHNHLIRNVQAFYSLVGDLKHQQFACQVGEPCTSPSPSFRIRNGSSIRFAPSARAFREPVCHRFRGGQAGANPHVHSTSLTPPSVLSSGGGELSLPPARTHSEKQGRPLNFNLGRLER